MSVLVTILLSLILLGLSALFSGLSLGLMSLSLDELRRKAKIGDSEAKLVYPIRARGHELSITLIFANVLVNAALTLILREVLPDGGALMPAIALLVSTLLITMIGEISARAYLRRYGLKVGAMLAPYINFFMRLMQPFVRPLANFVTRHIGEEEAMIFTNEELLHMLQDHVEAMDSKVEADELRIARNALEYGEKLVDDVMTPRSMVVALEKDKEITTGVLSKLQKSGHMRIPVYDEDLDNVVGIIYMHDLVGLQRPDMTAYAVSQKPAYYVNDQQQLSHVLNAFIRTRHHLFIVVNEFEETVGIVTIEDILEQIIGRKIVDEFDKFDDIRAVAKLNAKERRAARGLIGGKKG